MRYILGLIFVAAAGCSSMNKGPSSQSIPPQAPSDPTTGTTSSLIRDPSTGVVECVNEKDERSLEVIEDFPGCKLKYTKNGTLTTPAKSGHGLKYCEDAKVKIRKKLEKAGFKCS